LKRNSIGNLRADAAIDGSKELSDAVNVLTLQMRYPGVGIFKDWFLETALQLTKVAVKLMVSASA
jgi:hypothetical protein